MTAAAAPAAGTAADGTLRPGGLALTDHALDLAGPLHGGIAWDLGCGTGATVRHLSTVHGLCATGVDRSAEAVARARLLAPDLAFLEGSAAALPCEDASLDAILLECSWSLAAPGFGRVNPDPVLREVGRALRPGGALIVTDLYAGPDPARPVAAGAVPLPTQADLRGTVAAHGFAVMAFEDHTPALRSFVAATLFRAGSLAGLLGSELACGTSGPGLVAARPGYFLLVARKGA